VSTPDETGALMGLPVLVVDDNATNRRVLEATLEKWGMRPDMAEGTNAALAMLRQAHAAGDPFPLVLTDCNMPERDGFELAEEIKRDPQLSGATIMMLSSGGKYGDASRCRALGIAAWLTKPVRPSELQQAILGAVGSRSLATRPMAQAAPALLAPARTGLKILVAEDNSVNRLLDTRLLTKQGHLVTVAGNGKEALDELERQSFDLLLMDVQMPEMDGIETTAAIREREQACGTHLPIIALTAHALSTDRERCLAAGMDGYVSKPLHAAQLFQEIERLVQVQDRHRQLLPPADQEQSAPDCPPSGPGEDVQARPPAVLEHQPVRRPAGMTDRHGFCE